MITLLFNPFEKYAEKSLLLIGSLALLAIWPLAYWTETRYDGVIDVHYASGIRFVQVGVDLLMDTLCLFLALFGAAFWGNRKTRAVDILSTVLIARIPLYTLICGNIGGVLSGAGDKMLKLAAENPGKLPALSGLEWSMLLIFGIVAILCVVWSVALLYNGYKVASNARGVRPVVLFVVALLVAEVASKLCIAWI